MNTSSDFCLYVDMLDEEANTVEKHSAFPESDKLRVAAAATNSAKDPGEEFWEDEDARGDEKKSEFDCEITSRADIPSLVVRIAREFLLAKDRKVEFTELDQAREFFRRLPDECLNSGFLPYGYRSTFNIVSRDILKRLPYQSMVDTGKNRAFASLTGRHLSKTRDLLANAGLSKSKVHAFFELRHVVFSHGKAVRIKWLELDLKDEMDRGNPRGTNRLRKSITKAEVKKEAAETRALRAKVRKVRKRTNRDLRKAQDSLANFQLDGGRKLQARCWEKENTGQGGI